MAVQQDGIDITLPAAADLSTRQYHAVAIDTNGRAALSGSAGNVVGILQNKPSALGQAARVRIVGVSKHRGGAALGEGDRLQSNAQGFGTAAAGTGDEIFAVVLTATGGSGDITDVMLDRFRY